MILLYQYRRQKDDKNYSQEVLTLASLCEDLCASEILPNHFGVMDITMHSYSFPHGIVRAKPLN